MRTGLVLALTLTSLIAVPALAADSGDQATQVASAGDVQVAAAPEVLVASASTGSMAMASSLEAAPTESTTVNATTEDTKWHFRATPIAIWTFNIKGPVTIKGRTRNVNASWDDVSNNLDTAGGLGFAFGKGNWTWEFTGNALKWEKNGVGGSIRATSDDFDISFTYSTIQFGLAYALPVFRAPNAPRVEFLGFVRSSRFKLEVDDGPNGNFNEKESFNWIDPFIGLRVAQPISGGFGWMMSADIGGFGISDKQSELTWDFMAALGYHWKHVAILGGYKAQMLTLHADAGAEVAALDQRFQGPVVSLSILW